MRIATHSGPFHADDAFGVACFAILHGNVEIVRTRDPKELATADVRVDVGGEYNTGALTFDHHQRGGAGERENGIPLAGFGLIWRHYGLDVVEKVIGSADPIVASQVEKDLVQQIDAGDCGVKLHEGEQRFFDGPRPVLNYTLSHTIAAINPSWHESQSFDAAFVNAMSFAKAILKREIIRAQGVGLAEAKVRAAIGGMDGQIVVLDEFCPWQDVVVPECPEALFIVFPSSEGDWMAQAVPKELGSFETRKSHPEAWRGLRDEELQAAINIPTAIFVHPAGFIGGAKTREDAIAMARLAVTHQ